MLRHLDGTTWNMIAPAIGRPPVRNHVPRVARCAFYLKIINVGEKGFYRIGVASIPGRLKLSRKYFARGLHSCLI
jgi:hypothetical protein